MSASSRTVTLDELGLSSSHQIQPRFEGYNEYFDPPLEGKHECPICLLRLREPVQTSCGHRFCRRCIVSSIGSCGPSECPVKGCHESVTKSQIYPDKFAEREMMTLQVLCKANKQNECLWKGPLGDLEDHQSECPYVMVSCNYNDCKKEVKRKDLQQHMATECLLRKILCDYCNEAVLWNESKQHFENCIKYPQQCEKWREEGIERGKGLQSEVVKNVKELQSKIEELDNLITLLSNEGDHLKQRQETNEAQMRHETPLCGLEIDDRFGRQVDGMYTWKIENFRDCFQDAISGTSTAKYSPPFYTSKYGGYKLRMRINLNGVDDGVSNHMALFLHLREGDYDAILDWPLKREFRLSILDQSEDKEMHHDISKALVAKPHWRACQRPPENYFRGFGYKEFAPLEQILQPQYTKNDTLLVKFEMIG